MGWKEDNKGVGPWPFVAQPNKWGYLNNPNWMIPPNTPVSYDGREDEEPQIWDYESGSPIANKTSDPMHTHIPCGHWHRSGSVYVPPMYLDVNLYVLLQSGTDSIIGINFDEKSMTLSYVDSYWPGINIAGICIVNNSLIFTVRDSGVNSRLVELDTNLSLIGLHDSLGDYDVAQMTYSSMQFYNDILYYFEPGFTDYQRIVAIDYNSKTKLIRYIPATVITGSDTNLYACTKVGQTWGNAVDYYPITGTAWTTAWDDIEGNDYSGPVGSFGVGTLHTCRSARGCGIVEDGYLYVGSGEFPGYIKKIDMSTETILYDVVATSLPYCMTIYQDRLFACGGTVQGRLAAYSKSNLSSIGSVLLPEGTVFKERSICYAGGKIIVAAASAWPTHDDRVYAIDPTNLTIDLSYEFPISVVPHSVCNIDDKYVAVACNNSIYIFELVGLTPVASYIYYTGLGYPSSFSAGGVVSRISYIP